MLLHTLRTDRRCSSQHMSASAPFGKEEQREARRLDLRVIKENGIIHTRRKSEVQNKIPFSPSPQETYKPDTYLLKMYTQEINAPLQNRSLGNFEKKKRFTALVHARHAR